MNSNGILRKHWLHVSLHFLADTLFFTAAFVAGLLLRFQFGQEASESLWMHWPSLAFGGAVLSAATYIAGLYSTHSVGKGLYHRALVVCGCVLLATLVVIGASYGTSARPLGRGVVLLGAALSSALIYVHHIFLLAALRSSRERVVYIVTSAFDEAETRLFANFGGRNLELVGVIPFNGYQPKGKVRVLGTMSEIADIVRREKISRVLCTSKSLSTPALTKHFCQLRYSGVSVMPLILLCEEIEQYVPLELVTHEWLLNASGEPQLFYIKKVKRLFDIVASVAGLALGAPLVALGALAIKLTSRGPIFYRQVRSGRFGRTFHMTKLRTMRVDAEKNGAVWSSNNDPRVTLIGRFLRRYRIDEVPQLWHVLLGEMSFVGPRPERPEFIAQLAKDVPYYEERLMVQPGLTGWAQVTYPYGASVLDARRKLEFDLYYMKHMSVFLDLFILLDTVRIVLAGGAPANQRAESTVENVREWERLKNAESREFALELA